MFLSQLFKKKEETLRIYLIKSVSGSFLLKAISIALSFLSSIILARLLGVNGLGAYAFAFALIQLLTIVSSLGTPQFIVRELSNFQAQSDWGKIRGLLGFSNKATIITSICFSYIIFFKTWMLAEKIDTTTLYTIWLALILLPLRVMTTIRTAMLSGFRHVILAQLPGMAVRPFVFLAFLFLAYLLVNTPLTPPIAMSLQVVATGVGFVLIFIFSICNRPKEVIYSQPIYHIKVWLKSTFPLLFVGGIQIINNQTDILMLGFFKASEDVGLYRVAQRGAEIITFSLSAVNLAIAPTIAQLYAKGEIERLQKIISKSMMVITIYSLPVGLILILGGKFILSFVFGDEFSDARYALAILSVSQIVNACVGPVILILNMTGHEKITLKGVAYTYILNILLNFLLIPLYGIVGAAIATGSCLAVLNIFFAIKVYKKLHINTTPFRF